MLDTKLSNRPNDPTNREKNKKTCIKKYGVENPFQSKEIMHEVNKSEVYKKVFKTKRKNGTFNTSSQEDKIYDILQTKFNKTDIIRNYTESRYPFCCDFYIKSLDLFIECNFHWTHGNHWFNKNNLEDINKLNEWKEKAKNSKYYKNAIETWTKRDTRKLETSIKNNLNYIIFWSEDDINIWFSLNCPTVNNWKPE